MNVGDFLESKHSFEGLHKYASYSAAWLTGQPYICFIETKNCDVAVGGFQTRKQNFK